MELLISKQDAKKRQFLLQMNLALTKTEREAEHSEPIYFIWARYSLRNGSEKIT